MKKSTNNLKTLRKAKGYRTLKLLSDATDIPVSTISAIELGTRALTPEFRKKIEDVLGEKIVEILQKDDPHLSISDEPIAYSTRLRVWREASNDRLEELLKEYTAEKDWGAVKEISRELLDRKITDKLKGRTP